MRRRRVLRMGKNPRPSLSPASAGLGAKRPANSRRDDLSVPRPAERAGTKLAPSANVEADDLPQTRRSG